MANTIQSLTESIYPQLKQTGSGLLSPAAPEPTAAPPAVSAPLSVPSPLTAAPSPAPFKAEVPTTIDSNNLAAAYSAPAVISPALQQLQAEQDYMAKTGFATPELAAAAAAKNNVAGVIDGSITNVNPKVEPPPSPVGSDLDSLFPEVKGIAGQYDALRKSDPSIAASESQLAAVNTKLADLQATIDNTEADIRAAYGGTLDESAITAAVNDRLRRISPEFTRLQRQQAALQTNVTAADDRVMKQLGFTQQDIDNRFKVMEANRNKLSDLLTTFGSSILDGLSPEAIAGIEKNAGLPAGVLTRKIKTLKEQEMEAATNKNKFTEVSAGASLYDDKGNLIGTAPGKGEAGPTDAQVLALAKFLYQNDIEGKYFSVESALDDARGRLGGTTGAGTAPTGAVSETGEMRTDRHNNPTAMTTDVAKTLGLVEGVDYTAGDAFDGGVTARLIGDPVAITIKGLDASAASPDRSAFYTKSGGQRWTHTAISDKDWSALSLDAKKAVVASMYQKEGGSGKLTGSAPSTDGASEVSPQLEAYARDYLETGKRPTGVPQQAFGKIAEIARTLPKNDGFIYSRATGVAPDLADTQKAALSSLYDVLTKINDLKEFDKQRFGGVIAGSLGKVFGSEDQQRYVDLRTEIVDLLSRARTGAALTAHEEKMYSDLLPGRLSEPLFLGADSQVKIDNFTRNVKSALDRKLNGYGVAIKGYNG